MAPIDFLPLPVPPRGAPRGAPRARHSSRNNKVAWLPSSAGASAPWGAPSIATGLSIAIEAARCGLENFRSRSTHMATIGTFKKPSENEFTGQIVTLSVQAKNVRIAPVANRSGEISPTHRFFCGRVEIGAAGAKRSNEGRDYLG